tara:strand:- start:1641 stop:1973 length:333 start_codon:yes stop_codon:yes gene_type:complete
MGEPLTFNTLKSKYEGHENMLKYLTYETKNLDGDFGLTTNTAGKQFKKLKAFFNWCFDKAITKSFSLKHIVTLTEYVENIYLTEKELIQIEELKLKDKYEMQVRDMFLIG